MEQIIKVHPLDNVAIPVRDIPAGTEAAPGIRTLADIPQGHKIALKDFKKGDDVIRYGVALGRLVTDVKTGGLIDEYSMEAILPQDFPAAKNTTRALTGTIDGGTEHLPHSFEGYEIPGNKFAGVRNILGIMTTVQCVAGVVNTALEKIKTGLLPRYPNVHDVTVINHSYGCGCTMGTPDSAIPVRTLKNLLHNPNFGGEIMVIALGCEKLTLDMLLEPNENNSDNVIILQEKTGFRAMTDAILSMAEKKLQKLNLKKRVILPLEKLCVGMQCGGSDAFSGITANPAAGYASDLLIRAGGTVLFSETTEVRDGARFIAGRCENRELAGKFWEEINWYDAYLKRGGADTSANPSPGNIAGGLSNIMEKTMGAIAKSGNAPISGILSPGERVSQKGLIFAATPASDFHCGALQVASGITLQVFMTGRGTPYGLAAAPVIKVSSRTELKDFWDDLIDINAGTIAEGKETVQKAGEAIFKMIADTASGRYTPYSERYRLYNDICLFDPAPVT